MTTVAAGGADELVPSGSLHGLAGIIRCHRKAIGSR
jgi:hypothetical protein